MILFFWLRLDTSLVIVVCVNIFVSKNHDILYISKEGRRSVIVVHEKLARIQSSCQDIHNYRFLNQA